MNELQEMKDRREQLTIEMESLQAALLHYEVALENPETIEQGREREVREQYNERKRKFDSLDLQIHKLNQKISRRENIANRDTLMPGYLEAMSNWKADEQELNEKRQSLSSRLEQIRQQAMDDIAKARQSETDSATAYAQAVAWGDTEGEKNANADAQKAAKNLAAATEHNRRQHLIITALEQELVTVDRYIKEAQREYKNIENSALQLAHIVLEEQWNAAALKLLDVGAKLYTAGRLIGYDSAAFLKLDIPGLGENDDHWHMRHISTRASYDLMEILAI